MKYSALLVALAILSGCATQPGFKPLPDSVPAKTKSVEGVVNIEQKELNADIVVSNTSAAFAAAGVFGLIPAMAAAAVDAGINSSRTKDAEAAVAPVRDALISFNTNEVVRSALAKELAQIAWTGNGPVSVNTEVTMPVQEKRYADSKHDAMFLLGLTYRFAPDFKTLSIGVNAHLFPKSADLQAIQLGLYGETSKLKETGTAKTTVANSLYTHNITVSVPLPVEADDIAARGKVWAANEGLLVRGALQTGANIVARMVANDLNKPVALTSSTASTLIKKEPYTLEMDGKRYKVTQIWLGQSTVVADK